MNSDSSKKSTKMSASSGRARLLFFFLLVTSGSDCFRFRRDATCGTPAELTKAEVEESLRVHNDFRSDTSKRDLAANELALKYDDELAARAQQWADQCVWDHGMTTRCGGAPIGQNMYMVGGGSQFPELNITASVGKWNDERRFYHLDTNTCDDGKVCGHFTQVAWAKTKLLGCAARRCARVTVPGSSQGWTNALVFVCNYDPPGNYRGESVFKRGSPCSQCAQEMDHGFYKCHQNLCLPCVPDVDGSCECTERTCENGSWNPKECACACNEGFYGANCEASCTCQDLNPGACAGWAEFCSDALYRGFMKETCPTTCGMCPDDPACAKN